MSNEPLESPKKLIYGSTKDIGESLAKLFIGSTTPAESPTELFYGSTKPEESQTNMYLGVNKIIIESN